MSDSLSSTSESSRSDVSREEQTTTRGVRGGAGGVASLIRAAKQQSGGLGALDKVSKDARIERCVSTIESSGVSPVKPNRNTRRLNSVPDQFTPDPNEINGDISRKVPLHPPSAVTNQTHTGDVESPPPPPKPPRQRRSASRSEFASVGEEEEEEEDEEFAAGIMGCEGNGVDDREEMEGSSEYVEQAMSSQSSNGSVTAQYQVTDPPGTRTLVAESPSVKRPMLPPSGKSRDVGSDRTPSSSPANSRKENRTPSSSPAHISSGSHTPSSSPANARKGRSASPRKERSKSPTKAGSESPSRPSRKKEMSKSPKDNKSPKIPLIPPTSTKAKTPPTPTRTTPPYKRSPKSGRPPPKPVPYATRHSREPSAEEEDFTSHSNSGSVSQSNPTSHSGSMSHSGTTLHSEDKDLKEENEKLKQQLRMLQLQLESSNKMTLSRDDQPGILGGRGSVLTDPLAPDDSVFRSRSRSVSPGFDEERDHFPSGNPRSAAQVATKPVPLPRTRAQTMSANSPQRKPLAPPVSAFSPSSSVPATVGFVTPGGATAGSREQEKAKPKVPILPPGSGSPIPKPRRQILSSGSAEPVKKSATNHVVLGNPLTTRRKSDEAVSANVKKPILPVAKAGTKVKGEIRGEVKDRGIKGEVKGGINGEIKGEVKGEVEVQVKAAPKQVEADKTKAVLTLSKLLPSVPPSANKHVPPPLVPPIKPEGSDGLRVTSSLITPSPKSVSPQTVSPAVTQSHASKSIPIPRNVGTTTTTPQSWVPRNSKLSESDNYRTGISESQPVHSPLSSSVPPPVLTEKKGVTSKPVQVKAPLNSVAKPVPSVAGRAKYKKVTLTDTSWIKRKESLGTDSCDSVPSTPNDPAPETPTTAAVPRYVAPAVLPYGASPSPTPVRSDSNSSNASRSGSASSTSRYSSASNPATPSAVSSAPFRSHPILPGPKPVQQAFIPPSPEPPSGKATPTKPPPPKVPDTVSAPPAKRRWLKTPSDGEKKAQRRHSFTRNTSNDDTATPLPSELKAKSKGGRWGRKALSNSQVLDSPKGGKGRPVSMMVETERKSDFTASASLPRGMQPEDGIRQQKSGRRAPMLASLQEEDVIEKPKGSPSKQKKSSGLLGRFKNKTTVQKSPEKTQDAAESSSSDDEQGGTIKRMPKLRPVPSSKDIVQVEDDTEPQYHQLFEYVFGVSLKEESKGKLKTELTYTFPPTSREFSGKDVALKSIPQFCFPDIDQWKPTKSYKSESYSFVLTDMEGNRRYGYCRRLLPAGTGARLPEVFCIVSPLGCFSLYEDILDQVEERRAVSSLAVFNFLKAISANPFPRPGRSVEVKVFGARGQGMEAVTFTRPLDSRLEHVDFSLLFSTLSQSKIIQLFSSLLMERRVIFCANSLSLTTGCAHALMALLYPFEWQHVFIPVLPSSLIDFVCSPLPYIIGINPASCRHFDEMDMEEAVVINLDKGKFLRKIGDETSILPKKLFDFLDGKLKSSTITSEYSRKSRASGTSKADEIVVNTFMTFFAYLYGEYSTEMKPAKKEGHLEFQRDEYIKRFTSKSTKRFLEAFHMTQMFEHFIEQRETPSKAVTVAASLFEKKLPELKERCQDIEIFSSKSRFDRWKMKKDLAKTD